MQSFWIECVWVSSVSLKEWEISHLKPEKVLSETQTVPRLQRKTEAGEIILWSNSLLNYPEYCGLIWNKNPVKIPRLHCLTRVHYVLTFPMIVIRSTPPAYVTVSQSGYWGSLSRGESNHWHQQLLWTHSEYPGFLCISGVWNGLNIPALSLNAGSSEKTNSVSKGARASCGGSSMCSLSLQF